MDYRIDESRITLPETGMYVRAIDACGRWRTTDISHLRAESIVQWLRSRGGRNEWAETVVLNLLGHEITLENQTNEPNH